MALHSSGIAGARDRLAAEAQVSADAAESTKALVGDASFPRGGGIVMYWTNSRLSVKATAVGCVVNAASSRRCRSCRAPPQRELGFLVRRRVAVS